jgi:hypothetical protein
MSKTLFIYLFLTAAGAGVCGGIYLGKKAQALTDQKTTEKLAIFHGCGEYNGKTGDFEWSDPIPAVDLSSIQLPAPKRKPAH